MRGRAVLLVLLALAGCGGGDAPRTTALGQCQREADGDPAVQEATERSISQLQEVRVQGVHDAAVARQAAVRHCLAARGLAPRGGVEPVKGDWLGSPLL